MIVRHRIRFVGTCPINGDPDHYVCDVFARDRIVLCEDVRAAVDDLVSRPVYQESLTRTLAERLGCPVRTRCRHTRTDVLVTCTCRPGDPSPAPPSALAA